MNEEYLWSKTGQDAEIERLEIALNAFRCDETLAAPPLTAKILPFKKEPLPRRLVQFKSAAIAAAACVAFFFAVALKVLFEFSGDRRTEFKQDTAQAIESPIDYSIAQPEKYAKSVESNTKELRKTNLETTKIAGRSRARKMAETARIETVNFRPKPAKIKNTAPGTKPEIRLTSEEKYAYDQLMTALSVTSSKLKMVKDKVEGADEKTIQMKGIR